MATKFLRYGKAQCIQVTKKSVQLSMDETIVKGKNCMQEKSERSRITHNDGFTCVCLKAKQLEMYGAVYATKTKKTGGGPVIKDKVSSEKLVRLCSSLCYFSAFHCRNINHIQSKHNNKMNLHIPSCSFNNYRLSALPVLLRMLPPTLNSIALFFLGSFYLFTFLEVKFTCFEMHRSQPCNFDKQIDFCNTHPYHNLEHFHLLQNFPHAPSQGIPRCDHFSNFFFSFSFVFQNFIEMKSCSMYSCVWPSLAQHNVG